MGYDDLESCGILGLIEALDRFDVGRGTKFEAYAVVRIRGAIIDQLRSLGHLSRSSLQKSRSLEDALARLHLELGRAPDDGEVAAHLGVEVADLRELLSELSVVIVSLDSAPIDDEGDAVSLAETIPDHGSPDPLEAIENKETIGALAAAIDELPERERLVVSLYYHDGLTMKEISQVLGVTESRVSQLHTRAVLRLRGWMRQRVRRVIRVA
jgi:RNA polymerase sigma factor for flagellar operon FliA